MKKGVSTTSRGMKRALGIPMRKSKGKPLKPMLRLATRKEKGL